ncbi:hypothetical protein [Kitasatospora sp. NPDC005856]|uniref:hypothetical protein n=1 Tax=Kitasatospora sp. NPDC005856 TaxID=3154566 RepID=UPI0033E5253B
MTSSQTWIQRTYNVPARRGLQLTWHPDGAAKPQTVTIASCRGPYLRLRLPGQRHLVNAHPTYGLIWPDVEQPTNRGWCWGCGRNRGLDQDGNTRPHRTRGGRGAWTCEGTGRPPTHRVHWRTGRISPNDHAKRTTTEETTR